MAAALLTSLPRYTGQNDPLLLMWSNQLCAALERWSTELHAPVGAAWIVNGTAESSPSTRDIDPGALTTIVEVVDMIGTLVQDLSRGSPLSVSIRQFVNDSGAVLYAYWDNPDPSPVVLFSATFAVPPIPVVSNNQFVDLWIGVQPDDDSYVIQPVLTYVGSTGEWQIASFLAAAEAILDVTPTVIVSPGTVLTAVVTCTGVSGSNYNYRSSFVGYSQTILNVTGQKKATKAITELEVYFMQYCANYPVGSTVFQDIIVNTGTPGTNGTSTTPTWTPVTNATDCGLAIDINSPTEITVTY